jgi:hypothetical protein
MPRATEPPGPTLLDLLEEQEHGPLPCPHRFAVAKLGHGWAHESDPDSPYFEEWVHGDPACRRSAFPGRYKQPFPTMGWSRKKQKDVPL